MANRYSFQAEIIVDAENEGEAREIIAQRCGDDLHEPAIHLSPHDAEVIERGIKTS